MMKEFKVSRALSIIIGVLFLFLAASCGGGGGGGDDGDDGGQPLGVYDFNLSFLDDTPMQITSGTDPATTIRMEGLVPNDQIIGSIDLDEETITFDSGPWLKATTNIWEGDSGIISINLDTDLASVDGDHPTEGAVTLAVGDPLDPDYTVTFTISTSDSVTTVDLENHETLATAELEWSVFEGLFWDEEADEWQRQASFTWYVLNFYFYQVRFVAQTIITIVQNDTVFPEGNVTSNGDTYPPVTGITGSRTISCTDGDGGPGSDFSMDYDGYWKNDPEDAIDRLYDGTIGFVGFLENSDEERDVITSTGFVPNSEIDPGGVFYDEPGLIITEVAETDGTFEETGWYAITGRFAIMFYEQDL